MNQLSNIPTNVVTGFLGAGKTTAILHLLKHKPENERWAILVNEFGEVGIDGSLIQTAEQATQQVYITEVPGGCMCCTAGVPMQVALNTLLKQASPDRLLIEPTGLGHPKEVMAVLKSEHYKNVLSIGNTITLVDARYILEERYTNHQTFQQQIAIADIVLASKADCYQNNELEILKAWLSKQDYLNLNQLTAISNGQIPIDLLFTTITHSTCTEVNINECTADEHSHEHTHSETQPLANNEIKAFINEGEGHFAYGWRLTANKVFDLEKLHNLVTELLNYRIKAVLNTNKGVAIINQIITDVSATAKPVQESKIEIISDTKLVNIEEKILSTLKDS